MKKGLTPLEYFINYYIPKPNDYQIEEFKRLIEDKEQGKYLFLIKNRRRLWKK